MAEVILDNVRKVYPNGHEAVRGVSLRIADGEFLVLVGPSGCGKSTTLRMVAGLEETSGGTIQIGGRVVNDVHPKDRDIAMVFQNYALYPHMTVGKNMGFALKLRGVARADIDRKVAEAARMLGIQDLLDRKPKQLSGGQRQRVAVGRAIVREPRAFLFDEPLSNLDAKLRVTTRAELKGLHQRLKTTTIYVTHDQEEAMTLGDRIVVMSNGLIQQVGAPLDVYRHPANRFVGGFIGTPPMNFIDGRLVKGPMPGSSAGAFLHFEEQGAGDGIKIGLTPEQVATLGAREGKSIVLGIRPHAVSAAMLEGRSDWAMSMRVGVVEPLGEAIDVTCQAASGRGFVARLASNVSLVPGQSAVMYADMTKAHFFEPGEFGACLTTRA
jgi:multiple sugar transport system ATP-binding protein